MGTDKCNNCESTESESFWDYEDGTVLCNSCHSKYGNKWQKEIDNNTRKKTENIEKKINKNTVHSHKDQKNNAFCHKCGNRVSKTDKFCGSCGAALSDDIKLKEDITHYNKKRKSPISLIFIILIILFIGYVILDIWAVSQVTPVLSFNGVISSISNFNGGITASKTHASTTMGFENPTFVPILFGKVFCEAKYGDATIAELKTGFFVMAPNSEKNIPVELQINNLNAVQSVAKGIWNSITGKTERKYIDVYVDFIIFKIKVRTLE